MHQSLCVCALIPRLETRTRLTLIIHRYEDRKPTNTGRLAAECLTNSQVCVRGHLNAPADEIEFASGYRPILLFPSEDARPLPELLEGDLPVQLFVPDGNWRQASKVRARVPGMSKVPCAILPPGPPTSYRLRSEPHAGGLATMEAIARAFGILESKAVQEALELLFFVTVERTLWARGALSDGKVTGGIPLGAERHDPRRKVGG